jgi:hypothetical protein
MRQAPSHRADSYHRIGPRKFSERHNLDIPAIVRRLNLKPKIRVEAGSFVTHLEDQRYVLGKIAAGLRPAVREALQLLCRENRVTQEIPSSRSYPVPHEVQEAESYILDRRESSEAIRLGIAAAEEGRVKPARQALPEIQEKLGISG